MAALATSLTFLVCLLFLFTFSSARNIHDPFSRFESEPENTHSDSKPLQSDTVSFTIKSTPAPSDPVPLTFISFRPINRHLPLSYRLGRHRCRHGLLLRDPRRREIPYGNDAIVRSGFDPVNRGGVRQVPSLWTRFRDGEQRFSEVRAHDHQRQHDHDHDHHREREQGGKGLLKRIRMFFNMF